MNIYILLMIILLLLDISCVVSLIFIENRDPTTIWAWLLVIVIFPFIGFILYLLLGQNISKEKIFRKKAKIDKNKLKHIFEKLNHNYDSSQEDQYYMDLIKMNYNTTGSIYTENNSLKTYINGEDKFSDLIKDIECAVSFINIQYYIFKCDELGMKLLSIMGKKVSQGVEVRLLVDGMGSNTIKKNHIQYIKSLGIKFSFFFPSIFSFVNMRINYRNHRKIVVIDGKVGYVGGFNVGDEYINEGEKFDFWRDTHLRIQGDAVIELQKRFALDWEYASKEYIDEKQYTLTKSIYSNEKLISDYINKENELAIKKYNESFLKNNNTCDYLCNHIKVFRNVGMQVISSGPDNLEEYIRNSYVKIINSARKHIYIQTPYLVPDEPMILALKLASSSGVDVRIMVPDKADHFFMAYALSASIDILIRSGIKFYKYKKGFIHSKTICADGYICSIGTANLDIRSFKLNFEINAIIYNSDVTLYNENIFLKDIDDCSLLSLDEHNNRSFKVKILESIIKLVFPLK